MSKETYDAMVRHRMVSFSKFFMDTHSKNFKAIRFLRNHEEIIKGLLRKKDFAQFYNEFNKLKEDIIRKSLIVLRKKRKEQKLMFLKEHFERIASGRTSFLRTMNRVRVSIEEEKENIAQSPMIFIKEGNNAIFKDFKFT